MWYSLCKVHIRDCWYCPIIPSIFPVTPVEWQSSPNVTYDAASNVELHDAERARVIEVSFARQRQSVGLGVFHARFVRSSICSTVFLGSFEIKASRLGHIESPRRGCCFWAQHPCHNAFTLTELVRIIRGVSAGRFSAWSWRDLEQSIEEVDGTVREQRVYTMELSNDTQISRKSRNWARH